MGGHAHNHDEPEVCVKVGIFFICVVGAIFLIAFL
jgi:hypothetical protein